jgi:pilus assembly protein CpaB
MNKRILLVTAAIVLALIGTIAVYSYAKSADNRAVAGTKAATVVVTTKRIPAGTSWSEALKGNYLRTEHLPSSAVPSSALTSITQAAIGHDAVAAADVAPGQIVLRQAFGNPVPKTGVLNIPKGDIAISVDVASDSNVAGYVSPGSQVIVFVTAKLNDKNANPTDGDDLYVNRTVVPRAEVLATSAAPTTAVTGTSGDTSTSTDTTVVTLALSQADAQRVILQQQIGQLYLGLLSANSKVHMDGGVLNTGRFKTTPTWVTP